MDESTIKGQDLEKKVMELNGSDMGGWKIVVELPKLLPPRGFKTNTSPYKGTSVFDATGFDIHLRERETEKAVVKHFSSCGEIVETILIYSHVRVVIRGEGAVEKALNLRECQCDVEDCKLVAKVNDRRKERCPSSRRRLSTGFTPVT